MKPTTKEPKKTISGELALLVAVMINSFGVQRPGFLQYQVFHMHFHWHGQSFR